MDLRLSLILYLLMDVMWITSSYKMYNAAVVKIQGNGIKIRVVPSLVAYALLVANVVFLLGPRAKTVAEFSLSGLVIYGVYNATTMAILKDYPLHVAVVDTLWGMFSHTVLGAMVLRA